MAVERIYLVGFMGAGKTSVGRALAAQLKWSFADLDAEIERSQKMTVPDIFTKSGERQVRIRSSSSSEVMLTASPAPSATPAFAPGGFTPGAAARSFLMEVVDNGSQVMSPPQSSWVYRRPRVKRSAATLQPATPVGGFSAGHVIEAREYRRTDDYGTAEPEISTPAPLPHLVKEE
jgi:hypothetical protein